MIPNQRPKLFLPSLNISANWRILGEWRRLSLNISQRHFIRRDIFDWHSTADCSYLLNEREPYLVVHIWSIHHWDFPAILLLWALLFWLSNGTLKRRDSKFSFQDLGNRKKWGSSGKVNWEISNWVVGNIIFFLIRKHFLWIQIK